MGVSPCETVIDIFLQEDNIVGLLEEENDVFPKCKFRLAVTGKGGVGKTVIAAMIGRYVREKGRKILLVDADPAMGLAYVFGADTSKTIGRYSDYLKKNRKAKREIGSAGIKDVLVRESLIRLDDRTSMLIMGKDEGVGCFCGINDVLKYGIGAIAKDYDLMVIDCEAGLEQVKRRVLNSINVLLVISDMTARGVKTARQIAEVVAGGDPDVVCPEKVGLVINRYTPNSPFLVQAQEQTGLDLLTTIPEDVHISEMDLNGRTIAELPADAISYVTVKTMLEQYQLIGQ